jgi:hypothetical protein
LRRSCPMQWLSCEAFDDPPDAVLFPEKEAVISRAVDKRRREFQTVRHCARRALRELGVPPAAVLPGERREPVWPPGVVGSLTHCTGYRARRGRSPTRGIDPAHGGEGGLAAQSVRVVPGGDEQGRGMATRRQPGPGTHHRLPSRSNGGGMIIHAGHQREGSRAGEPAERHLCVVDQNAGHNRARNGACPH